MHRPECWTCLTPSIYVSMPMKIGLLKEYIFFIDLKKGIVIVGWEKHTSLYPMRCHEHLKNFDIGVQCFKPLPLLWSAIPVFHQCSMRVRTPTLMNCVIFHLITNYRLDKLKKEIHLPNIITQHICKTFNCIRRYTPIFQSHSH